MAAFVFGNRSMHMQPNVISSVVPPLLWDIDPTPGGATVVASPAVKSTPAWSMTPGYGFVTATFFPES